jgi:hypothetical protein
VPPPPFRLKLAAHAEAVRQHLAAKDIKKKKKVDKALYLLRTNPRHNSLQAHKYGSLKGEGPNGEDIWTAYIEKGTGAWRLFFYYDQVEGDLIHVTSIGPHPKK